MTRKWNDRTLQPRQRAFFVPRAVVDGLVDAFLASRKGREKEYCSSFEPDAMRTALRALPGDEFVDFGVAVRALEPFVCYKMTGNCNRWTPWMQHRLNEAKYRLPEAVSR